MGNLKWGDCAAAPQLGKCRAQLIHALVGVIAMLCHRLHGLVRANHLNGMEARVTDYCGADGMLLVAIDDGIKTQVRVKPANVKLLCRLKVVSESSRPPLMMSFICQSSTMSPCVLAQ